MHPQPSIHRTLSAVNLQKYPITPGRTETSSGLTESQSHSCCLSLRDIPKLCLLPSCVGLHQSHSCSLPMWGYTKAILAPCPCGLYQGHSCSLPKWVIPKPCLLPAHVRGYTKAISEPCLCGAIPMSFLHLVGKRTC